MFSCEYCKIFKDSIFYKEHLWWLLLKTLEQRPSILNSWLPTMYDTLILYSLFQCLYNWNCTIVCLLAKEICIVIKHVKFTQIPENLIFDFIRCTCYNKYMFFNYLIYTGILKLTGTCWFYLSNVYVFENELKFSH